MAVYATWDSANKGTSVSLSGGDLVATGSGTAWGTVISTIGKSSGKWYWEMTGTLIGPIQIPDWQVGIAVSGLNLNGYLGNQLQGWSERTLNLTSHNSVDNPYGTVQPTLGDTVGVLLDMDGGTFAVTDKNGTSNGTAWSSLSGTFFAAVSLGDNGSAIWTANFGATAFAFAVPGGYNAGLFTGTVGGAKNLSLLGVGA